MDAGPIRTRLRELAEKAEANAWDEHEHETLERVIDELRRLAGSAPTHATVILFKPSGKYYTEERWIIPERAITPHEMDRSPDFRRIGGGVVLVPAQEPWGYPALLVGE